jgi:hypothetical protein
MDAAYTCVGALEAQFEAEDSAMHARIQNVERQRSGKYFGNVALQATKIVEAEVAEEQQLPTDPTLPFIATQNALRWIMFQEAYLDDRACAREIAEYDDPRDHLPAIEEARRSNELSVSLDILNMRHEAAVTLYAHMFTQRRFLYAAGIAPWQAEWTEAAKMLLNSIDALLDQYGVQDPNNPQKTSFKERMEPKKDERMTDETWKWARLVAPQSDARTYWLAIKNDCISFARPKGYILTETVSGMSVFPFGDTPATPSTIDLLDYSNTTMPYDHAFTFDRI